VTGNAVLYMSLWRVLDLKNRFDSLMLYGNELALVIFELLLICTVDSLTKDFITDAVITFVVMEVSIYHCRLSHSFNYFSCLCCGVSLSSRDCMYVYMYVRKFISGAP